MNIKSELKKSWIIMIKEFKQIFRKKALMIPLFAFPLIMIIFFGYGMGGTVKNVDILVVNDDTGTASSSLVQEIGSFIPKYGDVKMFSITYTKDMGQSEAERKIDAGLYKAVLIIPQDYSERVAKNESVTLTLLTDSSDTTSSGIIINFMKQLFAGTAGSLVSLKIPDIYGKLEYLDFLTPAVIALTVFFGTVQSTGYAIAGERQDGTIVRIMMTPVSRGAVILGKTLHQLILQLARAVILILGATVILGVTMNGSWLLVALVLIIFTFGAVGLGIAMSAISEDMTSFQQLSLLFTLPSMFATGVFYPLSSVPDWMRWIAYTMPLTFANNAMRTIMVKGQGLAFIANDLIILIFLLVILAAGSAAGADTPSTYNVPRSFDFGAHYYSAYGSPDINATIVGTNEFDRDQTITLPIDLMNRGKFLGFERDHTPQTADEIYAAQTEVKLDGKIVDATGVVASLSVDPNGPLEVLSPAQQVGSIKSGENTLSPLKFDIKIARKAKAGVYNLHLNLAYDYQQYAQISNPNATAQTYDASYWYGMMAQNQTLKLKVKTQADFEVVRTNGSLYAGREDVVVIAIKNTGEEDAKDARAIINPSDPLSTTDDQAFLYTIKPGDTVVASYSIKADSKAVPKTYAVDTVIRYENPDGDIKYSSTLQAPVEVKKLGFFQRLFGWI